MIVLMFGILKYLIKFTYLGCVEMHAARAIIL
jgi:hypothetical protein